jgi:hypothetical protein
MNWVPHLRTTTILISFLFTVNSFSVDYITAWPYEIEFNYEAGYTNDALLIKVDDDTDITTPEWKYSPSRNEKIAYIKGQTDRKIKVKFDSNRDSMHLLINVTVKTGTGIGVICNQFIQDYEKKEFVTLTLDGNIPSTVGKNTFTWEWEIYAISKESNYCSSYGSTNVESTHTYYVLYGNPQAPMAVPWTDVLDYSCDWASGESTAANITQEVTEGIFLIGDTDGDIDYDYPYGYRQYSSSTGYRTFDLTSFLSDIDSESDVTVNCSDVANLFNIFVASLGLSGQSKRLIKDNSPYYFYTNSINPIGTPGWENFSWGYHHVGWYNNLVDDPCIKVNFNNPLLPYNMSQSTYDDYLLYTDEYYDSTDTGTTSLKEN